MNSVLNVVDIDTNEQISTITSPYTQMDLQGFDGGFVSIKDNNLVVYWSEGVPITEEKAEQGTG